MSSRNLYALYVGIDKYLPPIPSLAGCVNDMLAVRDFIRSRTNREGFRLQEHTLMNEDATRINIIRGFENHLTKAGPDDVAFFYYSGHGSQEPAHEMFWMIEPDRLNETLVCYDSRQADGMDLADKELSTLLELVASKRPHVLVIMDCCNSGSGTRQINDNPQIDFMVRQSPQYDLTRPPDSYILPEKLQIDRSVFSMSEAQQLLLPRARHVALSAAQSFELAKETHLGGTRRGVFTYSLLEVLSRTTGALTYGDVMRRVSSLVTQRTFDQNPQLYALEPQDINLTFLGGAIQEKAPYFLMTHDATRGWKIDGGGVHGILEEGIKGGKTVLSIYPEETSTEQMRSTTRAVGQVVVSDVSATESLLEVSNELRLDPQKVYYARVISSPVDPMKFRISGGHEEGIALAKEAFQNSSYTDFLTLVNQNEAADYLLIADSDLSDMGASTHAGYQINRPSDLPNQPLVEQLLGITRENATKAIENLNHIARWERVLELENPNSTIPSGAVKIQIYDPQNNIIKPKSGSYIFTYHASEGANGLPKFKVQIHNTSNKRLYCVMLYMSSQFGIETQLFNEGGLWLNEDEKVWVADGQVFTGKVPDELYTFDKKEVVEIFKLIVSTDEYQASNLRQSELNLPKENLRSAGVHDTRALMFNPSSQSSQDEWNANNVSVRLIRQD